jgi:ATP adenylyltransferase
MDGIKDKAGFEVLWAPWRMEYVLAHKQGGCFLCALDREEPSEENLLLAKTSRALVVFNRYPYNNGHLLVAPRLHTADLAALDPAAYAHLMELFRFTLAALRRAFSPEGFNAGLNLGKGAGAGLEEHLHWHIVPRWNGDTNFMPVTAGARVIPEALAATHRKLAPFFAGLPKELR